MLVHCLFERFVNMNLFSMFVNNHTCCASVLLFRTNCPYECRNNCQMFAIRHVWYNVFVNLQECCSEIIKSLPVWPTVLFEAAILFAQMMYWSCDTFILGKIKESFSCRVGFYFVCQLKWYFIFLQSFFFLPWNYMCLGIEPLFDLSIFTAVDKVKDRILYNKVWKDNWTYWDTCQYLWKRQLNTCKSLKQVMNVI